jgi:hypothetical protein
MIFFKSSISRGKDSIYTIIFIVLKIFSTKRIDGKCVGTEGIHL